MKLSVAMIVKNESAMLKDCLESVKDADEIVVVDTGSEDNTVDIAKSYTDKVFTDYKWEDHFAKARNHAISKCTGDWILSIDADDRLAPGGIQKIRDMIAKHPMEYSFGIEFREQTGCSRHTIPYLYRRCKEVFFKGAAHNYLSIPSTKNVDTYITYGYSPAHKKDPNRTLRILTKAVNEDRTKPREMYYLAREYRYRNDWITALYWTNEYLKIATWNQEKADAYLMKAHSLWHLQRGEEARSACLEAIKINTNFKEALLLMAHMTGPINREKWLFMAELADNSNVLFVRDKPEKTAEYYEKVNDTEPRYDEIYKEVGRIVGRGDVLDIGCGKGALAPFIKNYHGFDMVQNPYEVADIYTYDYSKRHYDSYILLEVLEHLHRDIEVLSQLPGFYHIVFSVPSFDCPSHVRMFTQDTVRWRYRNIIEFQNMIRFNFNQKIRKWQVDAPQSRDYILLCIGRKI